MSKSTSHVAVVTGATSGIGFALAQELIAAGATVVIHGPTIQSAQQAASRLADHGANPRRLDIVAADFSRLSEVGAMARDLAARYDRVGALVNNAAIAGPPIRTETEDGNELTFQVNYLAPFLLTRLLTPALRAGNGRMVALSSVLHLTGTINWTDPQRHKLYSPLAAYAQSKLALTMFARGAALQQTDVQAISVHPGVAETRLRPLYGSVGGPVDGAAATVARLCLPGTQLVDGAYYDVDTPAIPAPLVENGAAVARMWKLTTRILGQARFVPSKAA